MVKSPMHPDEELFFTWAPEDAVWSVWAKPPVFIGAHSVRGVLPAETRIPGLPGGISMNTAVIVDLAGPESVWAALGLAEQGFRPVPLFNACRGFDAFIDLTGLVRNLIAGAARLAQLRLPPGAPPVFMLDARRMGRGVPNPGQYDNRSVVLPQDFPSAARLRERGLTNALLIHYEANPAADLMHVLRRWQEGGIRLFHAQPDRSGDPQPLTVRRPFLFRSYLHTLLVQLGLRRSSAGGFGGWVPLPAEDSGSGGFGYGRFG
ncbi:MAG: hypothetical protein U1E27_10270 [Kiritimatiellia bacterium]|nr:hypothetical protein [Kiritimatiellia bacterium]